VHGENGLLPAEEYFEVAALLRSKVDTLFGQPALEFRALHCATHWLLESVHTFVY